MRFDYSRWQGPRPEDVAFIKQLMDIYRNLLLQTGGDVDEALRWMEHFGEQYGFFNESFGAADFRKLLEESGEAERTPQGYKITPKGEKRIRQDSLNEIFSTLQAGGAGDHRTPVAGKGGERLSETRPYQFGDNLSDLDPLTSMSNAVKNHGIEDLTVTEDDLAVHEQEHLSSCATVLMVDISHSMILYGEDRITPAKKIALALSQLIRTRYARDTLDVVLFGDDAVRVPLRDDRYDLEAILSAITDRTKLVFIAAPNNPTGTTNDRAELEAYFAEVPARVLTVLDQAYFEYSEDAEYPDAISEFLKAGHNVLVLRTFSKIFGLAGLRVGYGVGPEEVVTAIGKVRRAFDVTSAGQEAALASFAEVDEIARRRTANRAAMASLQRIVSDRGLEPAGPAVANFLFVRVDDALALNEALLRAGVIVRPMGAFGAPNALRITAGTPDEIAFFEQALDSALDAPRARSTSCS